MAFPTPHMCDFCGADEPPARLTLFACRDFRRRVVVRGDAMLIETCSCHTPIDPLPGDQTHEQTVIGGWAACPPCTAAIQRKDATGLARIAAGALRRQEPESAARPLPPLTVVENGLARETTTPTWEAFYQAAHVAFWSHREGSEA